MDVEMNFFLDKEVRVKTTGNMEYEGKLLSIGDDWLILKEGNNYFALQRQATFYIQLGKTKKEDSYNAGEIIDKTLNKMLGVTMPKTKKISHKKQKKRLPKK